jgi:enoyl-CoA hydratase/carnithine racemase
MAKATVEFRKRIAYVTLNRPDSMNAIDLGMHEELWKIWEEFQRRDDVDVAIVTGAKGDRPDDEEAFCAGADLKTHVPMWVEQSDALLPRRKVSDGLGAITRGLHRIYKPIIGAINGWSLAGGFETALACDIRIASEHAKFGSFEVRRGFHHGDGGIVRLVNICGTGVALELLLTGEPIDAERALRCNMVSRLVAHAKLMETAEDIAARILRNDQTAVRSAKETVFDVIGRPLDDQLAQEAMASYAGFAHPPVRDLLKRFYEKTDRGRAGRHVTEL